MNVSQEQSLWEGVGDPAFPSLCDEDIFIWSVGPQRSVAVVSQVAVSVPMQWQNAQCVCFCLHLDDKTIVFMLLVGD